MSTERVKHTEYLVSRASAEHQGRPDYFMHLQMPLPVLVSICGHLQIALRTIAKAPERFNEYSPTGRQMEVSSRLVRDTVEQIIQRLRDDHFPYNAQFLHESWEAYKAENPR